MSSFLQCYKSSKDACPYVDLLLPQCAVVYVPKDSKRKHHELRFTLPNGDTLVLAVQSKEQAHRWLRVSCNCTLCSYMSCGQLWTSYAYKLSSQVVREVSGQSTGPEESVSPVIPRKVKLDKVSVEERMFVVTRPRHFHPQNIIRLHSWGEEKPVTSSNCAVTIHFPKQLFGSTPCIVTAAVGL